MGMAGSVTSGYDPCLGAAAAPGGAPPIVRRAAPAIAHETRERPVDILDRLLGHDAWTTRQLLERSRALPDALLDQPFEFGRGGVRSTFLHMIGNEEVWTDLMLGRPVRRDSQRVAVDELLARHDAAYTEFARLARELRDAGRLDELWLDVLDAPPMHKTYGGAITHVILHNMQHRGELLHMLTRLGLDDIIEGDALSWEQGPGADES
jgi:uncharacterized damage-inducible protein DinB